MQPLCAVDDLWISCSGLLFTAQLVLPHPVYTLDHTGVLMVTIPSLSLSLSQRSNHVLGEQKQPGDRDVSDAGPKPSGQEQHEVPGGRRRELWGAATPAGHLREQRHAEAPAVRGPARGTVCHPRGGLRPGSAGGRVGGQNHSLYLWRFGMGTYHNIMFTIGKQH